MVSETIEKTKREIITELLDQGMTNKEIAEKTGISYGTVGYYTSRIRKERAETTKDNSDRHLCRRCQYRAGTKGCDFYVVTDEERGCSVEECTRYVEGDRLSED